MLENRAYTEEPGCKVTEVGVCSICDMWIYENDHFFFERNEDDQEINFIHYSCRIRASAESRLRSILSDSPSSLYK